MTSIPAIVLHNGSVHADRDAFYVKKEGSWQPTTWSQYSSLVRKVAKSLLALGFVSVDGKV
jgi:long-subunit acyl-CoA synthetase (AMP-forming)